MKKEKLLIENNFIGSQVLRLSPQAIEQDQSRKSFETGGSATGCWGSMQRL
jgi:hypothetical protein